MRAPTRRSQPALPRPSSALRFAQDDAMRRAARTLAAFAASALLGGAPTATAATPRPDGHDRALMAQLATKVTTFQALSETTSDDTALQRSLDTCAPLKKDPSLQLAAVFALLPVLLIDVVNQDKPRIVALRDTVSAMDAHAPLFRQWLAAEADTFSLILRFDNHGKRIDDCKAAAVMLDKHSTSQDVHDVLGIDPTLIAQVFASSSSSAGETLKRLNAKMRPFFVAGGLTPRLATRLTT